MAISISELDIREAINDKEGFVLASLVSQIARENLTCAEIGSWKGYSASIIGRIIKPLGGHLYCVDHWQGNVMTSNLREARDKNIYDIFEHNMRVLELWDCITPVKKDSLTASEQFADGSIDFLFIDADHRYHQFIQDLIAWFPKIKKGGVICGHDCEWVYSTLPLAHRELISRTLDVDFNGNCHAGVVKALYDYFGDDYTHIPDTRIWFKEI